MRRIAFALALVAGFAVPTFAQCPSQSSAAVPQSPQGQNIAAGNSITYSWSAPTAGGVTGFEVLVSNTNSTSATGVCNAAANATSCTGSALPAGSYNWAIRTNFTGCTGGVLSTGKTFTVGCPTAAPNPQSPSNGATNVPTATTLTWSGVSSADSYDIYLGPVGTACNGSPRATTSTTSFTPPQLSTSTAYEWKVAAKLSNTSCPAVPSQCVTFTTAAQTCAAPGSFNLATPANGATVSQTPTLSWSASSGADKYAVRISTANPPVPSSNDPIVSASSTSYTPSLQPGTYYWYVDAFPSCSTQLKTSTQVASFVVASSCPTNAATLVSPVGGQNVDATQPITFQWTAADSAVGYDVDVSSDAGATFASIGTTTGTNATTFSKNLNPGSYIWVVRALYGSSCSAVVSGAATFSAVTPTSGCPTTPATLELPANGSTNVTSPVTFDWSDVAGATSYRLIAAFNGGTPAAIAVTTDSEANVSVPGGTVEWWVEANAANCSSVVSKHFTFTAAGSTTNCPTNPGTPALVAPANGASVTSPVTLQWTAVSGAAFYRIYAATDSDRSIIGTTSNTQFTASLPQGNIAWLIEAVFPNCPSTFSNASTFTVTTPTSCSTTPATLQSPANGASNVTSPVTLQWNGVQGATGYKVFIGTSATAGDLVAVTSDTQMKNVPLPAGTYFWWVDTTFAGCPDVHAQPFSFTIPSTTQCGGGTINLTAPAAGATVTSPVTLQWSALSGVSSYRIWAALNGGSPVVIARSNNNSQQVSLPSGSIEWWIEALFTNCPSVSSAHAKFTVQQSNSCGNNIAPVLTTPVNSSTVTATPVEFDWIAAPNAAAYRVWISTGGDPFVDIGFTKQTKLTHALDPGSVQWYVEAIYDDCPPVPSAKSTFTIPAPPSCGDDAPMIISPADGAKNVTAPVTLVWSAVPNATSYRVFASLDGGDTRLIAATPQATITKVLPPGTINWAVEAVFDGCPATHSAKATFMIVKNANCPTKPAQLVSPHEGAQNVAEPVHFDWNPVNGAVGYLVTIKHNDGVATHIAETIESDLTHDVPPGSIEWWVTTFFAGCAPLESAHGHFTVAPPPSCASAVRPLLQSPSDGTNPISSPVHFVWSRVPKAKTYKVWVSVDGAAATVFGQPTDNKLTIDVPSGAIVWFVEATFDACPSTKSAPGTFVVRKSPPPCGVLARPTASVPGQVSSGTPYDVSWTADDNANSYELDEASSADFKNATTTIVTGVQATFTHNTTTGAQRYFYRVRAISSCSDDRSGFSKTVSVVVLPPNANATTTHHSSVQVGTANGLTQQVFIPGVNPPVQFTARGDKPWISVSPSSGTLGPSGVTLTVTFDATAMNLGTNTGTIVLTYSGSGKTAVPDGGTSPSGVPVSISLVTPVSPGGTSTPPPDALIIPAVGHAPGANNSMFESDVRIANTSAQLQKYTVTFTLTGADGTQNSQSTTIQIDAGATLALDDILANFFGIGGDGTAATGSLKITPTTSSTSNLATTTAPSIQTVASSRTFNNTPNGTYGQYIPAIPFSQFIGKSSTSTPTILSLQQIANSGAYRTNFGLVEGAGEPATVVVHVFDNAGNDIADIPETLKPSQQIQLNGFLAANNINLTDGRIEVEVTSTTGKVTAYASVVDNKTNDPLLVLPVVKGALSSTTYVLPGIGDLNNGNANWRSDVRIFNAGANPANVTLSYVPQPGYSGTQQTVTYTIPPGVVKVLDNAMQTIYGMTNTFGALVLTTDSAASLVSTARTYDDTGNGTYGQFIAGVSPAESIGNGDRALQILQLESSSRYRTNIGIAETSGNPATVQVTAVTPDSKVSATAVMQLNANDFKQFSLDSFGLGTIYDTRVSVQVIGGTGRVTAYGSVIDATTQDPTYVPAQ